MAKTIFQKSGQKPKKVGRKAKNGLFWAKLGNFLKVNFGSKMAKNGKKWRFGQKVLATKKFWPEFWPRKNPVFMRV